LLVSPWCRFLLENESWLNDHLESFLEDDYLLFDCPGQVELYSHVPVLKRVSALLQKHGFNVCGVYLVDALFVTDASKLIAGNLMALSAMVHFELPHINVLSKCDLIDKTILDRYLAPSGSTLVSELNKSMGTRFKYLNEALGRVLDEYDMVSFVPLDITDEDSLESLLLQVDHAIQYGEDMEPKEPKEFDNDGTVPRDNDDDDDHGGHAHGGAGRRGDDDDGLDERLAQASRNASYAAAGLGMGSGEDDGFHGFSAGRYAASTGSSATRGTNVEEVERYFAESMRELGGSKGAAGGDSDLS
jgi:GPN-loop GTPase